MPSYDSLKTPHDNGQHLLKKQLIYLSKGLSESNDEILSLFNEGEVASDKVLDVLNKILDEKMSARNNAH